MNQREQQQAIAEVIGKVVRDELEDLHCAHADLGLAETMTAVNRAVRNGAMTVLDLLWRVNNGDETAARHLAYIEITAPDYWEPAEVLPDYRAES